MMDFQPGHIRGLCFDVDGTLSDTDDMFVRRLAHYLTPFRFLFASQNTLPFARRLVMKTETPGNNLIELFDWMGIDEGIASIGDLIYQLGLGKSPRPFSLIQGVREMLEKLHPHFPMSIVSARGQLSTMSFLDQFELTSYFTCIVTAHTCKHTKPFPDPILWAAKQMGLPVEHCLMIGDTVVDVKAGKTAGTKTAAVLCGFGQEEELRKAGADLIISETPFITDILLNPSL